MRFMSLILVILGLVTAFIAIIFEKNTFESIYKTRKSENMKKDEIFIKYKNNHFIYKANPTIPDEYTLDLNRFSDSVKYYNKKNANENSDFNELLKTLERSREMNYWENSKPSDFFQLRLRLKNEKYNKITRGYFHKSNDKKARSDIFIHKKMNSDELNDYIQEMRLLSPFEFIENFIYAILINENDPKNSKDNPDAFKGFFDMLDPLGYNYIPDLGFDPLPFDMKPPLCANSTLDHHILIAAYHFKDIGLFLDNHVNFLSTSFFHSYPKYEIIMILQGLLRKKKVENCDLMMDSHDKNVSVQNDKHLIKEEVEICKKIVQKVVDSKISNCKNLQFLKQKSIYPIKNCIESILDDMGFYSIDFYDYTKKYIEAKNS
ncbi:hypothetical protein EDEG_01235 [Edhazardia aedis USNM 41457]|uniref:Uncharacterized protein n=1 Tax=Edhazardia aedis (strain USNM 41457) TaxID=1003232 RepID=J9DTG2_EDHAE|nr:hypothetical protein EDEG_01235 [Edhazardia aedis USNM 41457]|eukprot:EJW04552.1 hypothetical protein EDEG_01235 [Edhazardia aedis USNM 41457]